MIFEATDCFTELSIVKPGAHGIIFVFRDELMNWLLSNLEPFRVLYRDKDGQKTTYGIYKAIVLTGYDMVGPEFARLSDYVSPLFPHPLHFLTLRQTRNIVISHLSKSDRGSQTYHAQQHDILISSKTLPCVVLQCIYLPQAVGRGSQIQPSTMPPPINATRLSQDYVPSEVALWPPVQLPTGYGVRAQALPSTTNTTIPHDYRRLSLPGPMAFYSTPVPEERRASYGSLPSHEQHGSGSALPVPPQPHDPDRTPNNQDFYRDPQQRLIQTGRSVTDALASASNHRFPHAGGSAFHVPPIPPTIAPNDGWYNVQNTPRSAPTAHGRQHADSRHQNQIQFGTTQIQMAAFPQQVVHGHFAAADNNYATSQYGMLNAQIASRGTAAKYAFQITDALRTPVPPQAYQLLPNRGFFANRATNQNTHTPRNSIPQATGAYNGGYRQNSIGLGQYFTNTSTANVVRRTPPHFGEPRALPQRQKM